MASAVRVFSASALVRGTVESDGLGRLYVDA